MSGERDKVPWWLRYHTPSVLVALPMVIVIVVGILTALVVPIIAQWLRP